jgi:hypothetical protein
MVYNKSMETTISYNCGNAPKAIVLKDLNIAFAQCDIPSALSFLSQDIEWNMVGNQTFHGQSSVAASLKQAQVNQINQLALTHILTHGNEGAVDGSFTLDTGQSYAFCNIYKFTNHSQTAKISHITSYTIAINVKE